MAQISYWDGPALFLLRREGPGRALVQRAKAKGRVLVSSGWSIAQARADLEVTDPGQIEDWERFVGEHLSRARDQKPDHSLAVPEELLAPMSTALSVSATRFVTGDFEVEKRFGLSPIHGIYVVSLINYSRDLDQVGMWTPETLSSGQPFGLRFTVPELFRRTQKRGRKRGA